jgi:hypothetical protein
VGLRSRHHEREPWCAKAAIGFDETVGLTIRTDGDVPVASVDELGEMDEPQWRRFVETTAITK